MQADVRRFKTRLRQYLGVLDIGEIQDQTADRVQSSAVPYVIHHVFDLSESQFGLGYWDTVMRGLLGDPRCAIRKRLEGHGK